MAKHFLLVVHQLHGGRIHNSNSKLEGLNTTAGTVMDKRSEKFIFYGLCACSTVVEYLTHNPKM